MTASRVAGASVYGWLCDMLTSLASSCFTHATPDPRYDIEEYIQKQRESSHWPAGCITDSGPRLSLQALA